MDTLKDRCLGTAEDDPAFKALWKEGRQENMVKTLFILIYLISMGVGLSLLFLTFATWGTEDGPALMGYTSYTLWFGIGSFTLAEISGRIGERILDWRDERKAKKELEEFLSRIMEK